MDRIHLLLAVSFLCCIASAAVMYVFGANATLQNDIFWKDLSGNPIYSQGGGAIRVGNTYYWYGVKYTGAVTYYNDPTAKNSETGFSAFTCYSSTDLVNWKFENNVFAPKVNGWVGRCGVAYNATTKRYVLISQYPGGELFATCSTPNGNFTLDHVGQVPSSVVNGGTGDQTIFNDDDGKSYLICSSVSGRSHLYVIPLRSSDFMAFDTPTEIFKGVGREGNCMFKYRGRYYFCSSDLHGWNTSHCYYVSASNILGPYSSEAIMVNSELDFCHVTQTGFFITVNGTIDTTVLFCGDRWSDFAGNGIGYNQWCPLSFNGITPVFNSLSQFGIDAPAGTWSVGLGNNYVLNPSFEADRVIQTSLAGWKNTANVATPHGPGRFCLQQTASGTSYQDIPSIPNGTYTLTAWVQSSGGQSTCKVFAANFGSAEMNYAINKAIGAWTQITIPDIVITNGKCQVGVTSVNNGNNWCKVDDFTLINNSPSVIATASQRPSGIHQRRPFAIVRGAQSFSLPDNTSTISLFTLSGKLLKTVAIGKKTVNMQKYFDLPNEAYIMKFGGISNQQ